MSLRYKVLWVDDRIDEFISLNFNKELKDYIDASFFESEIDMCESAEEAKAKLREKKYDVIFSDYNMSEEKGDSFIQDIRSQNINCEILFYSAQEEPPLVQADRISFLRLQSNRAYNELMNKIKSVIDLSLEKINDLTSIRGLVMAEVSDLDVKMTEIIEKYCKASEVNKEDLKNYIIQKTENRTKDSLKASDCEKKCVHVWKNKELLEVVHEQGFESYTKARSLDYIFKKTKFGINPFLTDYNAEIIQNRNFLAHCHSEIKDGKEILITNKGEKQFTNKEFKTIRSNILKYSKMFDEVLKKV
ncbi:MAG: response regulator [Treponema sp.]|nr:response regulator [Treponema sp.]